MRFFQYFEEEDNQIMDLKQCRPPDQPLQRSKARYLLSRRETLILGAAALFSSMYGCGSGSGSTPTASIGRTAATGNLTNQINQFSTSIERFSTSTWLGASASLDGVKNYTGRSTRAPGDFKILVQGLTIGLNGTRSVFERLCNAALMLDDMGILAESVTSSNTLTGGNALTNVQWLAGMMQQNFAACRVTGALFEMQSVAGLQELHDWAAGLTDPQQKLAAYAFTADLFNAWVDAVSTVTSTKAKDTWKLDVSAAVTSANVAAQLARIDGLLGIIPFTPGYRAKGATIDSTDDALLGATGIQNFAPTFLGTVSTITLSTGLLIDTFPQTVDPTTAKYDLAARIGKTGLGTTLAGLTGGIAASQQFLNSADWISKLAASAQAQINLVGSLYGFLQSLSLALLTTKSAFGTIITGEQAVKNLDALNTVIAANGSVYQKEIWAAVKGDVKALRDFHFNNGNIPTMRRITARTVAGLREFDQLGAAGVSCTLTIVALPNTVATVDCVDPMKPDITVARSLISGLVKLATCPRTFHNIELSKASLIYDLVLRNRDTLLGNWTDDGTLTFCATQFNRLIRREIDIAFVDIPAISQAALLCSGAGYVPSRNLTPLDLNTLPSMPNLSQITNLVGGVPIDVK